uniref:DAG1 domain-containing protein n=1 Tax=Macrostomum lignano TaxID=282301 RepID=A0A1I8HTU8_9PLAT
MCVQLQPLPKFDALTTGWMGQISTDSTMNHVGSTSQNPSTERLTPSIIALLALAGMAAFGMLLYRLVTLVRQKRQDKLLTWSRTDVESGNINNDGCDSGKISIGSPEPFGGHLELVINKRPLPPVPEEELLQDVQHDDGPDGAEAFNLLVKDPVRPEYAGLSC